MVSNFVAKNHPILGNLTLDFLNDDGKPYANVVLIGENGSGKSTVLNSINRRFEMANPDGTFIKHVSAGGVPLDSQRPYEVGFCYASTQMNFSRKNEYNDNNQRDLPDIDKKTYEADTSEKEVKSLLLNIKKTDNFAVSDSAERNSEITREEYEKLQIQSKEYRFRNAFNHFFENLKLKKIDCTSGRVIFEKNGKEFDMVDLSTGEKQIVVKGASVLKNLNRMENGVVLLDEPEIGMHPRWAKRILDYYKNLLSSNGKQTTQIIVATHSEWILEAALKDRQNTLVILLENVNGEIRARRIDSGTFVLPMLTNAEVVYEAFHVPSNDYHNQLYSRFQELTKTQRSVEKTDRKICESPLFDKEIHLKKSEFSGTKYFALPTYIRNAIDHSDNGNRFDEQELTNSIELLRKCCNATALDREHFVN